MATYVKYEEKIYYQEKGLPQGAGDSALYATIYVDSILQEMDEYLFKQNFIVQWYKYMDDFLVYIPYGRIEIFKENFEEVTQLKLDTEYEKDKTISFLDITISRKEEKMQICKYTKECASSRMINYLSGNSLEQKTNTMDELIRKIIRRTCNKELSNDLTKLEEQMYNNNYPSRFVGKRFRNTIEKDINQLKQNIANIPLTKTEITDRIYILKEFMERFNAGKLVNHNTRRQEVKNHNKNKNKKIAVYEPECIPFERIIKDIHKKYRLPTATFRTNKDVYKRVNGTTPQQSEEPQQQMEIPAIVNNQPLNTDEHPTTSKPTTQNQTSNKHKKENIGLTKCGECESFFILFGKDPLQHILENNITQENSPIYKHNKIYNHKPPTHIFNIKNDKLADAATLTHIYKALMNTIGISCHSTEKLKNIPINIKRMIHKYRNIYNEKKIGLPIDACRRRNSQHKQQKVKPQIEDTDAANSSITSLSSLSMII